MTTDNPSSQNTSPDLWDNVRITDYVLGQLLGDDRDAFEQEMASDPELAQAVEEATGLIERLEMLFAGEDVPELDASRRTAIQAVLGNSATSSSSDAPAAKGLLNNAHWNRRVLVVAALAATILGVVVSVPLWTDHTATALHESENATNSEGQDPSAIARRSSSGKTPVPFESVAAQVEARLESVRADFGRDGSEEKETEMFERSLARESTSEMASKTVPIVDDLAVAPVPASKPISSSIHQNRIKKRAGVSRRENIRTKLSADKDRELGETARPSLAKASPEEQGMGSNDRMMIEGRVVLSDTVEMDFDAKETKREKWGKMDAAGMNAGMGGGRMGGRGGVDSMRSLSSPSGRHFFGMERIAEAETGYSLGGRYESMPENPFQRVDEHPLSTFSVDVDTASYTKVREYLTSYHQLPPPGAVRTEELINYFPYHDSPPSEDSEHPLSGKIEMSGCPWNPAHRLARVAIRGKVMTRQQRPTCNLVFLIDTSGSMNSPNKLPLVIDGLKMLTKQLTENDRVAIVVYASSSGKVLDSTPASERKKIRRALNRLSAGGSTNGGQGIALAYRTARDNFIDGGVNRVILCTDGDFNVGVTSTDQLVEMIEKEAQDEVFLTVLGFGMDNHNDDLLEKISGRGNGNYAFIDRRQEARKVLVQQAAGTLVTIAKDVKIQVEFNPKKVAGYRLIGYENRMLAKEDFNDDQRDAGEIGAGHSVVAIYEWVPSGVHSHSLLPRVDDLKYQSKKNASNKSSSTKASIRDEVMTVKLRYKKPDSDVSTKVEFPVVDRGKRFEDASEDLRFTAAVASFGMQLRASRHAGDWKLQEVARVAQSAIGDDGDGLRSEFVELVELAEQLMDD